MRHFKPAGFGWQWGALVWGIAPRGDKVWPCLRDPLKLRLVPKTSHIELPTGEVIPILFEDRSVLAIDKPAGWMLVPFSWQKTNRNLQAALASGIAAGDFWARSRNLRFLRFVHRLDAETSGVLLLGKSPGAVRALGELFETRRMHKRYLAVVEGASGKDKWTSRLAIAPDPGRVGRMKVDPRNGKQAETDFQVLQRDPLRKRILVQAFPYTGRTHQIRVHLSAAGFPVVGDPLYGAQKSKERLALRSVELSYRDPFTRKQIRITAGEEEFLHEFGFDVQKDDANEGAAT